MTGVIIAILCLPLAARVTDWLWGKCFYRNVPGFLYAVNPEEQERQEAETREMKELTVAALRKVAGKGGDWQP